MCHRLIGRRDAAPVIEADVFYDGSGSPGPLGGKPLGLEIDVLVSICALERADWPV